MADRDKKAKGARNDDEFNKDDGPASRGEFRNDDEFNASTGRVVEETHEETTTRTETGTGGTNE